jgi:multiple antibiotic resistance protein
METTKLVQDALTLFLVVNPFGVIPVYSVLTASMVAAERERVARRACLIAAGILIGFIAVGEIVLDGIGVALPSFRVAGGLVLLLIALRRVLQEPGAAVATSPDVAVFPLATPLLAGPGAIIAAVLLTDNDSFTLAEQAVTAGVVIAIFVVAYIVLRVSSALQGFIGTTGSMIMARVFGLVLAALAVQTILEGLRPYWASLH